MSLYLLLIFFLLKPCCFKATTSESYCQVLVKNDAVGAFTLSESRFLCVVYQESLTELNQNAEITMTRDWLTKGEEFSFNIIQVSYNDIFKTIISGGEEVLYFADEKYDIIKDENFESNQNNFQLITYEEFGGLQSNTVLEAYEDKLLFVGSNGTKFPGDLMIFKINFDNNSFFKTNTITFENIFYIKTHYGIGCKFMENGETIFCAVLNNGIFHYGVIEESTSKFISEPENILCNVIHVVKLNENLVSVVVKNEENSFSFFFSVIKKKVSLYANKELGFTSSDYTFSVARKNDNSIYVSQNTGSLILHVVRALRENYVIQEPMTIRESSMPGLKITTFGEVGIITVYKESDYVNFRLVRAPLCKELTIKTASNTERYVDLKQLTDDYEEYYFEVAEFDDDSKNKGAKVEIIHRARITLVTTQFGVNYINYHLRTSNSFVYFYGSGPCQITLIICNPACKSCYFYSDDDFHTECNSCQENYLPLYEDSSCCISREKEVLGAYFDETLGQFRKCDINCRTCDKSSTLESPNCLTCKSDKFLYVEQTKSCKCKTEFWYKTDEGEIFCVDTCPHTDPAKPYINSQTKECLEKCNEDFGAMNYFFTCVPTCPEGTKEVNKNCLPNSLISLIQIIGNNIPILYEAKKIDSFENATYEIYKANELPPSKELSMNNISSIDLGDLDQKVKEYLGIENYFIFKLDIKREGQILNQVEYGLFKLDGSKIPDSLLEGKVNVTNRIYSDREERRRVAEGKNYLSKGIDVFDPDDQFYNDFCSNYTTEYQTDIILEDRKKFIYMNYSYCESKCQLIHLDLEQVQTTCQCEVKKEIQLNSRGFYYNPVTSNFKKKRKFSGLRTIKCYENFINSQTNKNYGFFTTIGFLLVQCLICTIGYCKGIKPIEDKLNKIKNEVTQDEATEKYLFSNTSNVGLFDSTKRKVNKKNGSQLEKGSSYMNTVSNLKSLHQDLERKTIQSSNQFQEEFQGGKTTQPSKQTFPSFDSQNALEKAKPNPINYGLRAINEIDPSTMKNALVERPKKKSENFPKRPIDFKHKKKGKLNKQFFSVTTLEEVISNDNRKMKDMFLAYLANHHIIWYTFFEKNNTDLITVKVSLFFLSIMLLIGLEAILYFDFFFTHIYKNKGKLDIIFNLWKNLLAMILASLVIASLKFLSFSQRNIESIQRLKKRDEVVKACEYFLFFFKVRLISFIVINIILLLCIVYFVSLFCSVFPNTQIHLFFDAAQGFILYMIYPIPMSFLITLFRLLAIKRHSNSLLKISIALDLIT